jgi:hypothetical protein
MWKNMYSPWWRNIAVIYKTAIYNLAQDPHMLFKPIDILRQWIKAAKEARCGSCSQNMPPGVEEVGPVLIGVMMERLTGGPVATKALVEEEEEVWPPPGLPSPAGLGPLPSILCLRNRRLSLLGRSSSSLMEKELLRMPMSSCCKAVWDDFASGKWGELTLAMSSSPSARRTLIESSVPPLVLAAVSWRRMGFRGGKGGAKEGLTALPPTRLRELLRDRWRSSTSSESLPEPGRATVGTRLVDMTKVGSEMSPFRTVLFIDSFSVLAVTLVDEVLEGAEGRRGEGTRVVGVVAVDPDRETGGWGEAGRPMNGETGGSGDRGEGWPDEVSEYMVRWPGCRLLLLAAEWDRSK